MNAKPVHILIKDLGESIAAYRLTRNLRQADIARMAGISRGAVSRLENGEGGTIDSLVRILRALNLDDRLTTLVPDTTINPLDPAATDEPRQRARPAQEDQTDTPWTWGEP
jgi:transcriptional regulator with XRE-family HTH domain